MSIIKSTPDYWKHFLLDVLTLVKQFGLLTFFMILGYADLRLNELISIIAKLQGKNMLEEDPHVTRKLESHVELFSRWEAVLEEAQKWILTAFGRLL